MAQSHPTVSIVTPAYNAAAFLPTLIASISTLATFCDFEWIVIDDGSDDNTAHIVETQTPKTVALTLIRQANVGVAKTRNRGLALAQGKYIWYVDADDIIIPAAVPMLIRATADMPDMISFQAVRFGDSIAEETIYQAAKADEPLTGEAWLRTLIEQKDWRHYLWLYMHRLEFLRDINVKFEEGILHEDIAFTTEAVLRAQSVVYVNTCAYRYRVNPQSITGSLEAAKLQSRIDGHFVVVEQLRAINRSGAMTSATKTLLQGEVIGQALQIFEVAKMLTDPSQYAEVMVKCRRQRLAQSLFAEAKTFKRRRQVIAMWLKQVGWLGR